MFLIAQNDAPVASGLSLYFTSDRISKLLHMTTTLIGKILHLSIKLSSKLLRMTDEFLPVI